MFLINIGADVSTQAKNGCTAFDMASLIGRTKKSKTKYSNTHEQSNYHSLSSKYINQINL